MLKNKIILFYGLFWENQTTDWIPFGPLVVYSTLKNSGFKPILIHEHLTRDYEDILKENADETLFFGVSAMTGYQIKSAINVINRFKKYAPKVPIIWGGAHATAVPYQTLQSKYVDYVCVGHAKENIINFAKYLQDKNKVADMPNILSKEYFDNIESKSYQTKERDNDNYIFPRIPFEDFDFSRLITSNNVLNYTSSIGCYGQCTFCSWGGEHPWKKFPLKNTLEDIEYLAKRYNITNLWFSDASLMANKEYLLDIAKGIIDRKLNIFWRCNARVVELNKLTTNDFEILEMSGLDQVLLGIENVSPRIQKLYKKYFDPETVTLILKKMTDFDIHIYMSFILGNPGGPLTDIEENRRYLDKWLSINPNINFEINLYTPYPGTPMTELAISLGYSPPDALEEYENDNSFNTKFRDYMVLPWFDKKDRDYYIKRYYELFPPTEYSQRKYRKDGKLITSIDNK